MNADNRETARNLFTIMTVLTEKAAVAALGGQSPHLSTKGCRLAANHLQQTARDLAVLSQTALYLANRK